MKAVGIILAFIMQLTIIQAQIVFKSINEVWEYSLSNNPENIMYQLQVEKAKQDKKTANSYLFPKAGVNFSGQKNIEIPETPVPGELIGMPGQTVYMKFGQNYSYNSGITVSKTLFDWQSKAQAKIAKLNVLLTEAQKDYFEQTLKEQVAQVYYTVLTSNQAVKISQKDFELADSLYLLAKKRFEQSLTDKLVLNQAKINRNKVFEKLEQNKSYQSQWHYNLKLLLGLTATDTLLLVEDIFAKPKQEKWDNTIAANEDYINIFKWQSEIARSESKKALARFTPKIDVAYYLGTFQYQNDFTLSLNSADWKPNSYLGLSVTIPVFTGFANKTQYSAAKISGQIARQKLHDETRKASINDSILLLNYNTSEKLMLLGSENFQVSGNSVELASQKYAQGIIGLDEYLKAFDDYLNFQNQYFNSLSDYLINKAILETRKNNNHEKEIHSILHPWNNHFNRLQPTGRSATTTQGHC